MRIEGMTAGDVMWQSTLLAVVATFAGATVIGSAHAQSGAGERGGDALALSSFLPVTLEDAYPSDSLKLKPYLLYERNTDDARGANLLQIAPRAELPIDAAHRAGLTLTAPYRVGNASSSGSGDYQLGVLYRFTDDHGGDGILPALALRAQAAQSYGAGAHPVETTLRFVATKSLGELQTAPRLHLNVSWMHLAGERAADDRINRYSWGIGSSLLIGPATAFVADFFREQGSTRGENSSLLEAGIRHAVSDKAVLALGAGAGLGDDSPDFRLLAGFEFSF